MIFSGHDPGHHGAVASIGESMHVLALDSCLDKAILK
jgi:hypothetical protein